MKERTVAEFISNQIWTSGKSLVEIAREIDLPNANFLSMIKKGRARVPTNRIPALAKALGIEPQSLFQSCLKEYDKDLLKTIRLCLPGAFLTSEDLELLWTVKRKLAALRAGRTKAS